MIIFGSRGLDLKRGEGTFFCPRCQSDRSYTLKERKRMGHLYWIPLLPLGSLGKFVECNTCKNIFHEDAQYSETNASVANKLDIAIKSALSAVILSDGVTDKNELEIGSKLISEFTANQTTVEDLKNDLEKFDKSQMITNLQSISNHLSEQGKVNIVEKCIFMSIVDGNLADEEVSTIKEVAVSLGIPESYVPGIVQNTLEKIRNN
jgi:uncharacterized tellurite resistance protein B-like protein